ncbi:ferredoxin-type protein NapG [Campylobacter sp. RM15925]|uniref:ferredoxin-type protein NapG n=1 Tax=Campylobacter TaxID=194 RepID=UPI0014730BCC|nr:ferredoxin-type protein NapG [Campylobacter sp. RM15925]
MKDRREVLKFGLKAISLVIAGGFTWSTQTNLKAQTLILRPPGARDEKGFMASCIRCGLCVEACPFDTLSLAKLGDNISFGTPYFTPREVPCYMCTDIPCTVACPTDALDVKLVSTDDKLDINKSRMGIAVLDPYSCIAFAGIQCDACYRACPLIDKALVLEYKRNERTEKHAFLLPVVDANYCTGCGKCENACVTKKAAIFVLPREIGLGEVNDNYVKGWIEGDDTRLKDIDTKIKLDQNKVKDYLNSGEI